MFMSRTRPFKVLGLHCGDFRKIYLSFSVTLCKYLGSIEPRIWAQRAMHFVQLDMHRGHINIDLYWNYAFIYLWNVHSAG